MEFSLKVVVSLVIGVAVLLILAFLIQNQADNTLNFVTGGLP